MSVSPIVLFTYNRLNHVRKAIDALKRNDLARESDLFIYSDSFKDKIDEKKVTEVRAYIRRVSGFNSITLIERDSNFGLAANIIDGVTSVTGDYGKAIILEDDLVVSPCFLRFMNDALEYFTNENRVWHISGWNYPICSDGLGDVFLWRAMSCWGWATWYDRWCYFEKNANKLIDEFSPNDIHRFNLDGVENFWGQVIANQNGNIDTWAIFWYATIFKHSGLCLNPVQSYVDNVGFDGSGIHCGKGNPFKSDLSAKCETNFDIEICEDGLALERIKSFYRLQKKPLLKRMLNRFLSQIAAWRNG